MAKKRPIEDPPAASSSESEEENNSDQETDSDADIPKPQKDSDQDREDTDEEGSDADVPKPTENPAQPKSDSASDSDTDSDSDRPSNFTIKPIQSKQQPETPVKSSKGVSKRVAESEAELGLKELKKSKFEDEGMKKASAVQRLFSEDDEVALLEGIIEFQSKKGIDAYSDIAKFHEFIKKSIHFDASTNQLKEKIRRLKNKFQALVKKSGEDPVISKPHDLKVFNLSKKLWGSNSGNNVALEKVKKSVKTKNESGIEGGVGGGITLALASKGEEGVSAKKQKKVANGEGPKKEEKKEQLGGIKANQGGVDSEGDDAEDDRMVVYEKRGGHDDDFSVTYPLCVGGLMEAEGLSEKSKGYWVQNLGLIGKAKLEEYEAKLAKIKWAELELFIQKSKLVNEKLSLLLDASKSN